MKLINCFLPFENKENTIKTIESLQSTSLVGKIVVLASQHQKLEIENVECLPVQSFSSSDTMRKIAALSDTPFTLIYTKSTALELGQFALERFIQVSTDTNAGLVYSDFYKNEGGELNKNPVIDYQDGSVRDDFNFGSVLFYNTAMLKQAVTAMTADYEFAGLYDLRLRVSQQAQLFHLNEYLYSEIELDTRKSGEKQFDYVDPKNRAVQIEMEDACTNHLKMINAFLAPQFNKIAFSESNFSVEASVIIPVRNRVKTIEDAIKSVLVQKTSFAFNLIIVDNFSTDGTSELIEQYAQREDRIVHSIPSRHDLGIGGCWNVGVHSDKCGKFAVQLDSDDVYQSENTLQTIVNAFYEQNCAMVIGSYTMTNFAMETIAPGLIDHKEWTAENGRNNALRINGLGAPRAFYTPVLRSIKVPNTSYGEDYALGLRISRDYQIGRIYESLYLCRRWDENSDAALDVVKTNANNLYKDKLRTIEIQARKNMLR